MQGAAAGICLGDAVDAVLRTVTQQEGCWANIFKQYKTGMIQVRGGHAHRHTHVPAVLWQHGLNTNA